MIRLFLGIYDFMVRHCGLRWLLLAVSTILLVALTLRLSYKEDISDFLPLGQRYAEALRIYQSISSADRIFVIFQLRDTVRCEPDSIVEAIECYLKSLEATDGDCGVKGVVVGVDMEKVDDMLDFVYRNIPYFLSEADYERMDSLLAMDGYVASQLREGKRQLMLPSGGIVGKTIAYDPLSLFAPVVERLQNSGNAIQYEMYEGHIFSPDMRKSIIMVTSQYGASETERNAQLISFLRSMADSTVALHPDIDIHLTGGPVIAVGNARQIKTDSMVSVTLAMLAILALLFYVFRNVRNLLLIAVSIAWGWLFAMGGLSVVHSEVSLIVIGISAVILGIAVNYPLHMIAHLSHGIDRRSAFKDIVTPLVVGNVTTIGAFLALVPLHSVALRDLGLFASFLLLGTICFVLFFLPHLTYARHKMAHTMLDRIVSLRMESKPWMVVCIVVLTIVFGYFSLYTKFDADLSNINYMTDGQKQDLAYFQQMLGGIESRAQVYAVSSGGTAEQALRNSEGLQPLLDSLRHEGLINGKRGCVDFVASREEQEARLGRWRTFAGKYILPLTQELEKEGASEGFSPQSFAPFIGILRGDYEARELSHFLPLAEELFGGYMGYDSIVGEHTVVDVLHTTPDKTARVKRCLGDEGIFCFDMVGINSAIANHLSDNFNYIGWMCGLIVFFFLWLSMGSVELAVISFVPMAISWVWILGAMAMLGIQFNIVNIILATFIFGQGDDYTIFMTEGACYEYAYRRKILGSYKNSIIISALIMFIGIGTLIIARHPALHSLAEVTIIGMLSVVLMAYVLPPMLFRSMVSAQGKLRPRPLYLRPVLTMLYSATAFFLQLFSFYVYRLLLIPVRPSLRMWLLHRYAHHLFWFNFNHIPGVRFRVEGFSASLLSKPVMVVCNHQSLFDPVIFMALSPRCIVVSNQNPPSNPVISRVYRWLGFVALSGKLDAEMDIIHRCVAEGYSIVVFPEGERNPKSSILRFHKGAFYLADKLGLDILPVLLHGANDVLPRNSISLYRGSITVKALPIIVHNDISWGCDYSERTKSIRNYYKEEYQKVATEIQTAMYYKEYILDHYRYKGVEVVSAVRRRLKTGLIAVDSLPCVENVAIADRGYGELALAAALVMPQRNVVAILKDEDHAAILRTSAEGVYNITIVDTAPDGMEIIKL